MSSKLAESMLQCQMMVIALHNHAVVQPMCHLFDCSLKLTEMANRTFAPDWHSSSISKGLCKDLAHLEQLSWLEAEFGQAWKDFVSRLHILKGQKA